MLANIRNHLKKDENAVSAVIGTILMIAVTVILGGVIYAAIGGFGGKDLSPKTDYGFKAVASDPNSGAPAHSLKISYVSGPSGLTNVVLKIRSADGTDQTPTVTPTGCTLGAPGDLCVYALSAAGTYSVNVLVGTQSALDTTVTVS